jgi:hypothetical protein
LYSPANIVYLGRYFLEPLFRLLGTMIGVRQQYPSLKQDKLLSLPVGVVKALEYNSKSGLYIQGKIWTAMRYTHTAGGAVEFVHDWGEGVRAKGHILDQRAHAPAGPIYPPLRVVPDCLCELGRDALAVHLNRY